MTKAWIDTVIKKSKELYQIQNHSSEVCTYLLQAGPNDELGIPVIGLGEIAKDLGRKIWTIEDWGDYKKNYIRYKGCLIYELEVK